MPSPFPGMNPYLEQDDVWEDFHGRFIVHAAEALTAQIRPNYIAKTEERIYIQEPSVDERRLLGRGDVSVALTASEPAGGPAAPATGLAVVEVEAPAYAKLPVETERQRYIEIRDRRSRDLVTVIELLSPSNKQSGPDREQYLAKRRELLATDVHFIEIDLLRGGPRLPLEDLPDCDYYVLLAPSQQRSRAGVWPIRLRDGLPTVPVPLRAPDRPARLDLKSTLDRVYDAAGYEDYIYPGAPHPPLHPDDSVWARQFLPA